MLVDTEEFVRIQTRTRQDPGLRLDVLLVDTEEFARIQKRSRQDPGLRLKIPLIDTAKICPHPDKNQTRPRAEAEARLCW